MLSWFHLIFHILISSMFQFLDFPSFQLNFILLLSFASFLEPSFFIRLSVLDFFPESFR